MTVSWATAQQRIPPAETLEQAWAAALANDAQLDAARWDHAAASAELDGAQALRRPQLDLASRYGLLSDEPSFRTPGGVFAYQQDHALGIEARLRLPLDTAGEIAGQIDAASSAVATADYEVQRERLDIKWQVALAYLRILRSQRQIDVAQQRLNHLDAHTADARQLFERGRIPRHDLLAVDLKQSEARIALLTAENQLATARHAYNRQLGRPLDARVRLASVAPDRRPLEEASLSAAALQLRPELAWLDAYSNELNSRAEVVASAHRPHVHLEGGWRYQENRHETPNGIASAAVVASWTPYDGGRRQREAEALQSRATAAQRRRDDLASKIQLQVRTSIVNHQESLRRLDVAERSVQQANENLRAARLRYQYSQATSTDVLDAVAWQADALQRWHQAIFDTVERAAEAHYAAGAL